MANFQNNEHKKLEYRCFPNTFFTNLPVVLWRGVELPGLGLEPAVGLRPGRGGGRAAEIIVRWKGKVKKNLKSMF